MFRSHHQVSNLRNPFFKRKKSDIDMFYIFLSLLIIQILCKNIQCKSFIDRDAKSMCIHPIPCYQMFHVCKIYHHHPLLLYYGETCWNLNSFFQKLAVNWKERVYIPHQILLWFYSQQYRIATPIIWHTATL